MLDGLIVAWQMGFKEVQMESNSQAIINLIKGVEVSSILDKNLISQIRQLMAKDWRVKVQHIYREANFCADWLATYSLMKEMGLTVYTQPPKGMYYLLIVDATGVTILRTIVM